MTDMDNLERDLVAYVGFRRRTDQPEYTFARALRSHRRQVLDNLRDDGDEMWLVRNSLLERLAHAKNVDLSSERQVQDVLAERHGGQGRL